MSNNITENEIEILKSLDFEKSGIPIFLLENING